MGGDDEEWESLNIWKFSAWNAFFCAVQHVPMYPFEVVKTRIQVFDDFKHSNTAIPLKNLRGIESVKAEFRSVRQHYCHVVNTNGYKGLFRGIWWYILPACASEALYFSVYKGVKHVIGQNSEENSAIFGLRSFMAGFISEAVVTPINVPSDMVTQRIMIMSQKIVPSGNETARIILKEGGMKNLFRGTKMYFSTYGTFSMFWFGSYEIFKRGFDNLSLKIRPEKNVFDHKLSYLDHFNHCVSGALAGTVACIASNPLDVVKTRFQVEGSPELSSNFSTTTTASGVAALGGGGGERYIVPRRSITLAVYGLIQEEGWRGLVRGLAPRIAMTAPQSAISFILYELAVSLSS